MYAGRDSSARLIAASSTRNITDQAAPAYNRGQKQYEAGKYEGAVRNFAEAVRLDPNSQEARYALACALTKTAKPAEAIDEFKQLLNLNPTEELKIWSYYLMGNAYADLGQYKEAIENYQEAIKLKPDLSKPHYNLGLAYAASNRITEAAAEFNQAVQLKPDYAEAHYNLGVAYLQLGKKQEAGARKILFPPQPSRLAKRSPPPTPGLPRRGGNPPPHRRAPENRVKRELLPITQNNKRRPVVRMGKARIVHHRELCAAHTFGF